MDKLNLSEMIETDVPQALKDLQLLLGTQVKEIKACFKDDVKVAIVIRSTTRNSANIVIGDATNEDINFVIEQAAIVQVPSNDIIKV